MPKNETKAKKKTNKLVMSGELREQWWSLCMDCCGLLQGLLWFLLMQGLCQNPHTQSLPSAIDIYVIADVVLVCAASP